jgi:hypothetical protein
VKQHQLQRTPRPKGHVVAVCVTAENPDAGEGAQHPRRLFERPGARPLVDDGLLVLLDGGTRTVYWRGEVCVHSG